MRILVLLAIAAAAGCSSQPQTAQVSTPAAGAAAAETNPPAAATTAATAGEQSREFRPPSGYKIKKRGKTTVYCRDEVAVGTRFATEYCFTQAQLKDLEARRKSMQEDLARRQRACTTASACGGN